MARTPIILNGYVQWVYPWRIQEGEQFYSLGEHACYCPVEFIKDEDKTMLSFHNDPAVKEKYLARVHAHAVADKLVQGTGWDGFKGCAVGCTLEAYDHTRYPIELGIPEWLAHLEDKIFEGLPVALAMTWPERFLLAVPVGVDLGELWHELAIRRIGRLIELQTKNKESAHDSIKSVIQQVIDALYTVRDWHNNQSESAARSAESAWSAESAARSAWSARSAESAARSAESAARSARSAAESAESAARSAESAARSAESAWSAWSAAGSAESAGSAARSAWSAWYAAWVQEANDLIDVLGNCK